MTKCPNNFKKNKNKTRQKQKCLAEKYLKKKKSHLYPETAEDEAGYVDILIIISWRESQLH